MTEVLIRVRVDTASGEERVQKFNRELKGTEATAKSAGSALDGLSAKFFLLKNNLEAVVGYAIKAFDALKSGAVNLELKEAFEEQVVQAGGSLTTYVGKLKEASGSTISEFGLMQSASKAMSLELTSDVEQISGLLEIARFKARQMGTDTATAFNDIVTGAARASPLILDNLGLTLNAAEAQREYAESIGVVVSRLTDAQKKEAILQELLETGGEQIAAAGGIAVSAADKFRILEAEISDATTALMEYLALEATRRLEQNGGGATQLAEGVEGGISKFREYQLVAQGVATALKQVNDPLLAIRANFALMGGDADAARNSLSGNAQALGILTRYLLENAKAMGMNEQQVLSFVTGLSEEELAFRRLETQIARTGGYQAEFINGTNAAARAQAGQTQQTEKTVYATQAIGVTMALAAGKAATLTFQANDLAAELGDVAANATAAGIALRNALMLGEGYGRFLGAQNKAANNSSLNPLFSLGDGGGSGLGAGVKNILDGQAAAAAAIANVSHAGVSEAEKAAKQIQEAYARELATIRSAAEQALNFSDAVDPLDPLLDEFGLRNEQEASEFARRMRAITAEAMSGQGLTTAWKWVEMYKIEGADLREIAANAEAARRAAISGADLSKLDADAVARDVEEILANNANRDAFLADVVARVQARTGAANAKIQEALGQSVGFAVVGAGESASADLLDSMQAGLVQGIQAERAAFEAVGADMMRWIVQGATAAVGNNGIIGKLKEAIETDIMKLLAGED